MLLVLIFVLWNDQDHLLNQSERDDNDNEELHIIQTLCKPVHILSPSELLEKVFLLREISQNNMAQAHLQNDQLHTSEL